MEVTHNPRATAVFDHTGGLKIYISSSLQFYIQGKADRITDNGKMSCGGKFYTSKPIRNVDK